MNWRLCISVDFNLRAISSIGDKPPLITQKPWITRNKNTQLYSKLYSAMRRAYIRRPLGQGPQISIDFLFHQKHLKNPCHVAKRTLDINDLLNLISWIDILASFSNLKNLVKVNIYYIFDLKFARRRRLATWRKGIIAFWSGTYGWGCFFLAIIV